MGPAVVPGSTRNPATGRADALGVSRLGPAILVAMLCWLPAPTQAVGRSAEGGPAAGARIRSIADNTLVLPDAATLWRVFSLQDFNTRVVVIGTALLGMAAGIIGTFSYLRGRAMLGDALSHATLPGIGLAFLLIGEKHLPVLLLGAAATGVLGMLAVLGIRRVPRLKEDAAIGIVLSVFFGAGAVLLSIIQETGSGQQAGLQAFIYGRAAAMLRRDAIWTGLSAAVVVAGVMMFYKEFRVVCFDETFAASQGRPVWVVDLVMTSLMVLTTIVGLQAVGLILIVALLIIPAAAARFWTDRLGTMTLLAGGFGAVSGWLGSSMSALMPRMPTGAIIVIVTGVLFLASMLLAPRRGVFSAAWHRWQLTRRVVWQHLLRAIAEIEERQGADCRVSLDELLVKRSWSRSALRAVVARAQRGGAVAADETATLQLTDAGRTEAHRVLRNHRLWELYLIRYADIAPSHVDRDADEIEHLLPHDVVRDLERTMAERRRIPPSPHPVECPA